MDSQGVDILKNIVPIGEVPKRIPIAEKTLRNWRSSGLYPELFIKLGGKVFVDLGEFTRIINAQKTKAEKEARRLGLRE